MACNKNVTLPGCKRPWNNNSDSRPFLKVPRVIHGGLTEFPGVALTSFACRSWVTAFFHQKPGHTRIMRVLKKNWGSTAELIGTPYVQLSKGKTGLYKVWVPSYHLTH